MAKEMRQRRIDLCAKKSSEKNDEVGGCNMTEKKKSSAQELPSIQPKRKNCANTTRMTAEIRKKGQAKSISKGDPSHG
jgi:hypothetical protein